MKKYILPILLLAMTACEKGSSTKDEPRIDPTYPKADFAVKTQHPFTAIFTNYSVNATSYSWDFGDGTTSTEINPRHRYSGRGVYKVTLTARNYDGLNSCYTNLTVENPTKCYISGYNFLDIPANNQYYRFRFTDDYDVYATNFATTNWTLLSSANTPYKYIYKQKAELTKYENKGYLWWYEKNTTSSGSGTTIVKVKVTKSKVWSEYPDSLTYRDDGVDWMRVYFSWE